ncbi:MAG: HDOD domain-containing protein [Betaproteobacteria bacterium]|nr:HDOD domain-containing protein [Betaproteobacteria bacterium]
MNRPGPRGSALSWWRRLFGRAAVATEAGTPALARPDPASAPPAGAAAAVEAAAARAAAVARRPLLNRQGEVAGFEFSLAPPRRGREAARRPQAGPATDALAVLEAMRGALAQGQLALAAMPLAVLSQPAVLAAVPEGALLALDDVLPRDLKSVAADMAALRARGAQLGGCGHALAGTAFTLVDCSGLDADGLAAAAADCRRDAAGLLLVAVGLPDIDSVEDALQSTVDLAAGSLQAGRGPQPSRALPPQVQRVCALINQVLRDAELSEIAAELRADIGLSYQLLRHVNSAWYALPRTAHSVDDAVMMIGRDGLFRWLTQLLTAQAAQRPSSRALQEVALARARLMELLGEAQSIPATPLFTTGLLSLLDVMLRMPIGEALAPLHLPQPATRALVNGDGPWHPMLDLVRRLEKRDMQAASELAELYGGIDWVSTCAEESWHWARAVRAADAGPGAGEPAQGPVVAPAERAAGRDAARRPAALSER